MTQIDDTNNPHAYQHVVCRGLPYERGLAHGQQAKSKVQENVTYYRRPGKLAHSIELMEAIIQHVYKPALEQYYPSGFQEMQGIADGAGVTLDDVILLNSRYDLARLGDEPGIKPVTAEGATGTFTPATSNGTAAHEDMSNECTSVIFHHNATASGDMLTAQNWDMSARLWENDCIIYLEVHPDPSENKPSIFLVTEAGQLGRSGMNSAGLGVTANSLMSSDDYIPYPYEDGNGKVHNVPIVPILPISMLRRMILESNHFAEAMTCAFNFPRHVSNNVTVSTAEGFGLCLEVTPDRIYKVYREHADDRYLVHTNHFTHSGFLARQDVLCKYPGGSSWFRRERFEQSIRSKAQAGTLTNDDIILGFSDHISYPEAVCVHPDRNPIDAVISHLPGYPFRSNSATVACIIYNLSKTEVTVCKGPPCQGKFQTFKLEGPKGNKRGSQKQPGNVDRPEHP
ncbi:acyl-coenzyme a 6-aminopenicillanic acid acyl-transferase [Ophiostoma piceae UAMH 11346]|uniref:Acyl-coenzyme a 6-aminopenicillanic acid acyl-transferase n=1 Tax=Ophiostoma piceae (strain UAMH 11346) TaxID=1262450 RepID=S3CBG6_OPHP1|nr:acyl-coenzyme a 6-aminopenicillanic acid acyl-transferase [Ophiostoma piceae UAMH 11346]